MVPLQVEGQAGGCADGEAGCAGKFKGACEGCEGGLAGGAVAVEEDEDVGDVHGVAGAVFDGWWGDDVEGYVGREVGGGWEASRHGFLTFVDCWR